MQIKDDILPDGCYGGPLEAPRFVILHATAGTSYAGARQAYVKRRVSAHYTVDVDGTVWRNVPEGRVAWHAGVSRWGEVEDLNRCALGVELVGPNTPDARYPPAQVAAAVGLVRDLCRRHAVPWDRVLTHAMVSPGRKSDPANFTAYFEVLRALLPAPAEGELPVERLFVNGKPYTNRVAKATVVGDKLYLRLE